MNILFDLVFLNGTLCEERKKTSEMSKRQKNDLENSGDQPMNKRYFLRSPREKNSNNEINMRGKPGKSSKLNEEAFCSSKSKKQGYSSKESKTENIVPSMRKNYRIPLLNSSKKETGDVYDSPTKSNPQLNKTISLQQTPKKKFEDPKTPRKNVTEVDSIKSRRKNTPKVKEKLFNKDNDHEISNGSPLNESFIEKMLMNYNKIKSQSLKRGGTKKIRKRNQRDSYEKYGVLFPSCEEVLESISKMRSEAEALDAYEKEYGHLNDSILPIIKHDVNKFDQPSEQNLLDCKHLSPDELQEYFQQNQGYITSILNESLISKRHERFKNYNPRNNLTMQDLTYSPSIVVFTDSQRDLLIKLLEDHFDPSNDKTEYLFKVLLPDLCSKIFMDVYKKSEKEAVDYLNWRPLDGD